MPVALARGLCLALCGLVTLAAAPAFAAFTGLVIIPIAEVTPPDTCVLNPQYDTPDTRLLNTEIGLGGHAEAGVDFDLSENPDSRALLNVKYQVYRNTDGTSLLALGICNVGTDLLSSPYAVASHKFGPFEGHLGLIRTDEAVCPFVGWDKVFSNGVIAMADYTAGDESYWSVGVAYVQDQRLGVLVGLEFPNAGGETVFTVQLAFAGPYHLR